MKYFKYATLPALALTLAIGIAGCGNNDKPQEETKTETETPANPDVDAEKPEEDLEETEDKDEPEEEENTSTPKREKEEKPGTEFSSGNESFSIKVIGTDWESERANDDGLILSNPSKTLNIMIQRNPKDAMKEKGVETLDQFVQYYHENAIAPLLELTNAPETTDLYVGGMEGAKADELELTDKGSVTKYFIAYIESDASFYSYTITGAQGPFDNNIDDLKESLQTLIENH